MWTARRWWGLLLNCWIASWARALKKYFFIEVKAWKKANKLRQALRVANFLLGVSAPVDHHGKRNLLSRLHTGCVKWSTLLSYATLKTWQVTFSLTCEQIDKFDRVTRCSLMQKSILVQQIKNGFFLFFFFYQKLHAGENVVTLL